MPHQAPEQIDWFASRDEDSYRDEAKNILDSYAHPWDILAELAQNCFDAIVERKRHEKTFTKGEISIELVETARSVRFYDNGTGIDRETLKKVLCPHYSAKRGRNLRGEKGVGLTYIALVGNQFSIVTKQQGNLLQLEVAGVQDWLRGTGVRPTITISVPDEDPFPRVESFTDVNVAGIPALVADDADVDIFSLTFAQLDHLLRSRTAIGNTGALFNKKPVPSIGVTLTRIDKDNECESRKIPFQLITPGDYLQKNSLISLEEVRLHLANDEPKKVFGKSIYFSRTYTTKAGKEVLAYCFLTSRHTYNQISEQLGVPEDLRVQGGIYISTKGMPTGISLAPPRTGRAGYWPNFFLLLEYDNITLDLGRKSITAPRTIEMLGRQAAEVFNEVDRYIKYSIREDEGTLDAVLSQEELADELGKVRSEQSVTYTDGREGGKLAESIPFLREPRQEQDVIAIFCMLLARNKLPYELLRLSTTYRYDCFLQFPVEGKPRVVVAEFKFAGEGILKDLSDSKARYGQLNVLICWRLDEKKLRQAGFVIESAKDKKRELPGATHKLSFPSSEGIKDTPIAVICISDLISQE